jgi:hypothetical protein
LEIKTWQSGEFDASNVYELPTLKKLNWVKISVTDCHADVLIIMSKCLNVKNVKDLKGITIEMHADPSNMQP